MELEPIDGKGKKGKRQKEKRRYRARDERGKEKVIGNEKELAENDTDNEETGIAREGIG